MLIQPFAELDIPQIAAAMAGGRPWLPESCDYWFFREFHGFTSFVASQGDVAAGGIIACIDPNSPTRLYIDQVAVHPSFRNQGIVHRLFAAVEGRATEAGCTVAWLSTDPANPAVALWPKLGYQNCTGDQVQGELSIRSDFKGPGRHRALFEKVLPARTAGELQG